MNRKKSTRQLIGIDDIKNDSVVTADGELAFYFVHPSNLNVLPEQGVRAKVQELLGVLKGMAELELLALDSKESFQDNRQFYRQRLEQEGNPAIRRLLAQDRQHLDDTQTMMASSREFCFVLRQRKTDGAVHYAAGQVLLGAGEAFIAAGVESMTRVPMGGFNLSPNPALLQDYPAVYMSMGQTAENVAERYAVSRVEQEEMAVRSHAKAVAAREAGLLREEIVAIDTPAGRVAEDGCIRPGTNLESLAQLKPAFGGSVTAATSSPLTDGSAALLVCSEDFARRHGLVILARIKAVAVAGCAPEIMGMGPVQATRKVLQRAGLGIADIDLVEINEAFASQSIACIRELGLDMDRINLDGGALAIGHPLGATGARITGKAAALLRRTGGRYAIATQCIAGGQGVATLLEAVE